MPINRTASPTRNWSALRCGALLFLVAGGCSSPKQGRHSDSGTTGQLATKIQPLPGDSLNALIKAMGDSATISEKEGVAVIDGTATRIPAYQHAGVLYVAVAPFVRARRALLLPSPEHQRDATVWSRQALLHLKTSGLTQGRAYQTAVREGILP